MQVAGQTAWGSQCIGSQLIEALVPKTVVSIRHQGKFYSWKERLRKRMFWPSTQPCSLLSGWWVLALATISTNIFFCTVRLNTGLSNSGHKELVSPLGLWLLYLDERCAWAPLKENSNKHTQTLRPKGANFSMTIKLSSRTCLFWTTSSGNIINNKVSLSQCHGISILQPNAFPLSKWHSDVLWDDSMGTCQDPCWLLQTETHTS